jgi:hypothetical protein
MGFTGRNLNNFRGCKMLFIVRSACDLVIGFLEYKCVY